MGLASQGFEFHCYLTNSSNQLNHLNLLCFRVPPLCNTTLFEMYKLECKILLVILEMTTATQ